MLILISGSVAEAQTRDFYWEIQISAEETSEVLAFTLYDEDGDPLCSDAAAGCNIDDTPTTQSTFCASNGGVFNISTDSVDIDGVDPVDLTIDDYFTYAEFLTVAVGPAEGCPTLTSIRKGEEAYYVYSHRSKAYEDEERSFFNPYRGDGTPDVVIAGVDTPDGFEMRGWASANSNGPSLEEELGSRYVFPYNYPGAPGGTKSSRFLARVGAKPTATERVFTFSSAGDVRILSAQGVYPAWEPDWDLDNLVVEFQQGTKLVVESTLMAGGVTFTEADNGQGWGGIDVVGTGADLTTGGGTVVEHAATGVTVYDGATATIANSTLRDNTVGLDVLSDAGTTVSGTTITSNGTGIRSGVPQEGPGAPVPCFGVCRSTFTLADSFVNDNDDNGVYAISVDADVQRTEMSGNGQSGLRVVDATVDPFFRNVLEANGQNGLSFGGSGGYEGITVLAGGDLQMEDENDGPGINRVANNVGREIAVASGGTAFIGTYSLSGTPSDGRNSIYDATYGGALIANNSGATLYAGTTFWNAPTPPAGAFTGSVVKWQPASDCDYTVSPPDCPFGGSRSADGWGTDADALAGEARDTEVLRAEILAVRVALAEDPASEEAPGLVRTLASLHRRDRGDATGEYAASWGLLRSLRARLNENGNGLPAALRPTAEAALEAEAVERLTRGERDEARALVALAPLAEAGGVRRVLTLVEAHLEVAEGRYAEAAALVEAVAAEEAAADPESGMEGVLLDLAAVFAERVGNGLGEGVRGAGAEGLGQTDAAARGTQSDEGSDVLAVYPNPASGSATVALTLDATSDVRVAVYDVLGRRVALLAEGPLEAGTHRFRLDGSGLPAGVYLVRAEGDENRFTARITLMR